MKATLDGKAKPAVEGKPAAEAKPDPKPAVEETPAAEVPAEAPAAEEAPGVAPEEGEDDAEEAEGDGPVEPVTGKRAHLRLAPDDKVGRLAASLMKRNRDMPMHEAVARAQDQLGIKPKASEATPAPEAKPKSDLPETVAAVDAETERLEGEYEKAGTELRFEDQAKALRAIRKLDRHRLTLERDGERQQTQAVAAYEMAFTKSEQQAISLYEFAGNPESAGAKRMAEIEREMEANGDPLFRSPDKPLRIAQMAAAELNIAPRKKGAVAPVVKPPVVAAPKKQVLPSGDSRTTPVPANQKPAIDAEINAVKNVNDLRKLYKKIGLPT